MVCCLWCYAWHGVLFVVLCLTWCVVCGVMPDMICHLWCYAWHLPFVVWCFTWYVICGVYASDDMTFVVLCLTACVVLGVMPHLMCHLRCYTWHEIWFVLSCQKRICCFRVSYKSCIICFCVMPLMNYTLWYHASHEMSFVVSGFFCLWCYASHKMCFWSLPHMGYCRI